MITASENVAEFPFVEVLPKREKSKFVRVWDRFQELSRLAEGKGMLLPLRLAAQIIGVSKQRVVELCENGRLEVLELAGERFITENSVVAYAKGERKAGRPVKLANDAADKGVNRASWEFSKAYVSALADTVK
jgi:hypothetical protein